MFSKLFNKLTSRVWGTQFPYRDQTKKKPKPRRKKPRNPNQTKKKNKPDWTQVVTVKVPEVGDDDEAPNEAPSFSSLSLWVWWCFVDSRKLSLEDSSSIELNFITLDWAQQNWFHCARNVSLLNYFENMLTNCLRFSMCLDARHVYCVCIFCFFFFFFFFFFFICFALGQRTFIHRSSTVYKL